MRVYYLSSSPELASLLRAYRGDLQAVGNVKIASRWLDSPKLPDQARLDKDPGDCWAGLQGDIDDMIAARAIVCITEGGLDGGAHNVPWGMYLARRLLGQPMRLIIVGSRKHAWHCYPGAEVYASWTDFLAHEREA